MGRLLDTLKRLQTFRQQYMLLNAVAGTIVPEKLLVANCSPC